MRTLLRQFCESLEASLRPLLGPIAKTTESLEKGPEDAPIRRLLPGLQDIRHALGGLTEKVGTQQSYVACFGPLKSGKSTLLNALAGAWVSEVTALPAYPCMVFVRHAEQPEIKVTRYDGTTAVYKDPAALRAALEAAHTELAARVRARGDDAETFDPQVHYPQAIRRVDVGLPAPQLQRSGAVLVDSPGLFVKMRFGYDRMTKDFKRSAATAMFVVKTDNLFLEQVFDEFSRLLELFSKVFLVVNLDSNKQDLRPDGTLEPSLEKHDPKRIVEAFRSLSMDAPLRAAVEDGRLAIYPIDLQRAASTRLRAQAAKGGFGGATTTAAPAAMQGGVMQGAGGGAKPATAAPLSTASAATATATTATPDFDVFVRDLETYINSSEYLHAFMGDSLRQGDTLLREVELLTSMAPVREMQTRVGALKADRDETKKAVDRLAKAASFDWPGAFSGLRAKLDAAVKDKAAAVRGKSVDALGGVLDRWMSSDKGIASLVDGDAQKLFRSSVEEAAPVVAAALKDAARAAGAGGQIPYELRDGLADLGISIDEHARKALDAVDPLKAAASALAEKPAISLADVPVRKSFLDWILFRSKAAIRRRLFGTKEAPTATITPEAKAKTLGAPGREALKKALVAQLDAWFPKVLDTMTKAAADGYAPRLVDGVRGEVKTLLAEGEKQLAETDRRLKDFGRLADDVGALQGAMREGLKVVDALTKKWAETDPDLLLRPIEQAAEPDEDAPRPRKKSATR